MKATYYPVNGAAQEVTPANGKRFTYDELKALVGYPVEIVPLNDNQVIVVNEEGKLVNEPQWNAKASAIWQKNYPIEKYPFNNDGLIAGDALVADNKLID